MYIIISMNNGCNKRGFYLNFEKTGQWTFLFIVLIYLKLDNWQNILEVNINMYM